MPRSPRPARKAAPRRDPDSARAQPAPSAGGIEGLLGGLSALLGTLGELAQKGEELKRSGQFATRDGRDVKFHYGVSVRTLDGGRDLRVEPFGNLRPDPTAQAPARGVREPMVDIFEEEDHVQVVVEMPGIAREDATFTIDRGVLRIAGKRGSTRYAKDLPLPGSGLRLDPQAIRWNNGVFELRLTR